MTAKGAVTQEQISTVMAKADHRGRRIGEMLLAEGLITEELLAQALAEQRDLRYLDLNDFRINPKFFETLPVELMNRYQFLPVEDNADGVLLVAMTDPNNIPAIDELEMIIDRQI